jgi:formate-dependent nitrite reductase membrane component NrfD
MMEAQPAQMFAEHHPSANPYTAATAQNGMAIPGAARIVYDVAHPQPWGWIPALYLWTKSIAGGVLILAGILSGLRFGVGDLNAQNSLAIASPAVALAFLAITAALLIADLKRWDRFHYILIKPNPRSWLVWGTWILIGASAVAALWLAFAMFDKKAPPAITWLAVPLGLASACYSAFLFAQAKGRDLWQSPLFLWHLAIQAVMAGAATLVLLNFVLDGTHLIALAMVRVMAFALPVHAFMMLGEIVLPPATEDVHRAVQVMTRGSLGMVFCLAAIMCGAVIPFVLLILAITHSGPVLAMEIAAAFAALLGLLGYEYVWITAGQAPPLS